MAEDTITSSKSTYRLPSYAQPYYEEIMKQSALQTYNTDAAGKVTGVKPYVPYGGERVAGFTPNQLAVQTEAAGLTTPGQFAGAEAGLGTATGIAGLMAPRGIDQAFAYTPGTVTADTVSTKAFTDPGVAASYMNPYQQQVTDVQLAEARRQAEIAKSGAAMGSIGRGTFGGGRQALMQGEADRALATQLGGIQATGSQQAYQQGQQAFTADQARQLQAQQANQGANLQAQQYTQQGQQFGAGLGKDLGLSGLTTQVEGAKTLGQLGATEQIANLERLKAQAASAAEQRGYQQEIDNIAYQNFQEQQDYGRKLLGFQSDILQGNEGALGKTVTQYVAPPSLAGQLGSLGLAGLGLYNQMTGAK
jgi:hypothetical protein